MQNCRGSESIIEFLVLMEAPTTCLTCKIEKSDDECEFLNTGGVSAKGTPMVKLARSM